MEITDLTQTRAGGVGDWSFSWKFGGSTAVDVFSPTAGRGVDFAVLDARGIWRVLGSKTRHLYFIIIFGAGVGGMPRG